MQTVELTENQELRAIYPPSETCGKTKESSEKYYFRVKIATKLPPWNRRPEEQNQVGQRDKRNKSNESAQVSAQTSN